MPEDFLPCEFSLTPHDLVRTVAWPGFISLEWLGALVWQEARAQSRALLWVPRIPTGLCMPPEESELVRARARGAHHA